MNGRARGIASGLILAILSGQPLPAMAKITIVALGDSTTSGTPYFRSPVEAPPEGQGNPEAPYTHWIAKRHPEWIVLNRGVNGERTNAILARFPTQVASAHPKYVIVLAGVNDTYSGIPAEQTQNNLRAMYRLAREAGISPIAATILPFDRAAPEDQQKIRQLNAWIRQEAGAAHIPLCDLNRVVRDPKNSDHLRGSPDGLHPDLPTYRAMGEALADLLETLESKPAPLQR